MSLQSDIVNDWEFIDGVEQVTVTAVNPGGTNATATNVKALQRQATYQALRLFGANFLAPESTIFHLWNENGTNILRDDLSRDVSTGDTITQTSGDVWTVSQSVWSPMTSRFMCLASKQARTIL